jgi:hypothetical protein
MRTFAYSVAEAGFEILKEFAVSLGNRMDRHVRVAIVEFGNGKLDAHKSVYDGRAVQKTPEKTPERPHKKGELANFDCSSGGDDRPQKRR